MEKEEVLMAKTEWFAEHGGRMRKYGIEIIKGDVDLPEYAIMITGYFIEFVSESRMKEGGEIRTRMENYSATVKEACQRAEEMTESKLNWKIYE